MKVLVIFLLLLFVSCEKCDQICIYYYDEKIGDGPWQTVWTRECDCEVNDFGIREYPTANGTSWWTHRYVICY